MKLKEKRYIYMLHMPMDMYAEVVKYSQAHDLDMAKTIRKAIKLLINKEK